MHQRRKAQADLRASEGKHPANIYGIPHAPVSVRVDGQGGKPTRDMSGSQSTKGYSHHYPMLNSLPFVHSDPNQTVPSNAVGANLL